MLILGVILLLLGLLLKISILTWIGVILLVIGAVLFILGSVGRPVAGLLLAAGGGRRYGMPKALVPHHGRLLVEHGLDTLRAGGCEPVVVVLGAAAPEVRERADLSATTVVVNPDWPQGMGTSLRAGLTALAATDAEAAVILLVDTPGITPATVHRVRAHAGP